MNNTLFHTYIEKYPEGMYEKITEVTDEQVDLYGRIRISELAREMEKITCEHLLKFGIEIEQFQKEGKLWVACWNSINIVRLPLRGEKLRLRIWPSKNKSIMYTRKYAFYSMTGEQVICASTLFLLIDKKTRTYALPFEKLKDMPVVVVQGEPELPQNNITFPNKWTGSKLHIVQPFEIDQNGHVNNACYFDFIDELPICKTMRDRAPRHVWIRYSKELLENQEVLLYYGEEENILFIRGMRQDEEAFLLKITY